MPATPHELKQVVHAFEQAHPPIVRVLAELLLRGNVIFEDHDMLESGLGDLFEDWVLSMLDVHSVTTVAFAACLSDYQKMTATIDELERLP